MAAGAALGLQWLLHAASPRNPFAPTSLGEWIIRRAPGSLATSAIEHLGHQALHVLAGATIVGALALGFAFGRARAMALGAIAAGASLAAASLDPHHPAAWAACLAAVAAALGAAGAGLVVPAPVTGASGGSTLPDDDRRRLVGVIGLGVAGAVLGAGALRRGFRHVSQARVRVDRAAERIDDPAFASVAGLSPLVTARARHYVVDIDLEDPVVDGYAWRLRVSGQAASPQLFSLTDLRAMPSVERLVTLSCISNPVGGSLVGNARWAGVPLADLLRRAQPHPNARTLEVRAADGYRETLPLTLARRDDVLVAFAMNGALLPRAHGFPARLIVPGRYGVKNVKWLEELSLTDRDPEGYWEQRGWDKDAVVHTESRVDTPQDHASVRSSVLVAGVAWAGDRRVRAVEVSADDGRSWAQARLEAEADPLSWRRWQLRLPLRPGAHSVTVRAVDGLGNVQTPDRQPPHPAGATGYHRIVVRVG
jgi:DMSO/TMAO reductase YedYZ molybdopterin-dependent catalytic subunit